MEVIVSHHNTDLDGLAAMIAAKKLYPDAQCVIAGKLHPNVREFMALHRDAFFFTMPKDVKLGEVKKLILVDTKSPARIGEMRAVLSNPGLQVHIFDHHRPTVDDIHGHYQIIDVVGAATTLLIEKIREQGLTLSPFEATILAMGIYEDTGSLTFTTTTPRDAEAVAFLLAKGAKLSVVADFIDRPLSEQQKTLFNALIISSEIEDISGTKILIAAGQTDDYIGGLSLLVHKLVDILNPEVAVAVVLMDDRIHLVARSQTDNVDVARILAEFNGGGHATAASAIVREGNVQEVVLHLKSLLERYVRPEITAQNIMSAPVKSVPLNTTIDEAGRILLRYGHTGLPVVDGQKMVGIISRRDLDKAKHHGLGHAPVKGFMSHKVITVTRETTLPIIQHLMIEHNIGRLPVIEGERLAGIVSRTDVLRTLHGENFPNKYERLYNVTQISARGTENVTELMVNNLSVRVRNLLAQISYLADRDGFAVFAVGGFVRDLLLGVENLDLDLVVEGDGPEFARRLAEFLCGRVRIHEKFGTAMVILSGGLRLDVATARTEYYEYPAALPTVESSSLKQDLYRRDFTINTMALTLSEKNFGSLVDYFGGRRDLDEKVIRVMHNLSFVEDPTRIMRAVRFEKRFNFTIEEQTLFLIRKAIQAKMLAKLSPDRIREELKHILSEPEPVQAITRMQELDIWSGVFPEAGLDSETFAILMKIPASVAFVRETCGREIDLWIIYLGALVRTAGCQVTVIDARLHLTRHVQRRLIELQCVCPEAVKELSVTAPMKMSEIAAVLRNISLEGCSYILALAAANVVQERLKNYLARSQHNKLLISGDDIRQMGFAPGPNYKAALDFARDARLDGLINSKEEELKFVREFLVNKETAERG